MKDNERSYFSFWDMNTGRQLQISPWLASCIACGQLTNWSTRTQCASQKGLTDRLTMDIERVIMTWSCSVCSSVCKIARVTLVKNSHCTAQHSTAQHSTAQHSTAQLSTGNARMDFYLTHELYAYTCLPAAIASLQHLSTFRAGGCNSYRQPGFKVTVCTESVWSLL